MTVPISGETLVAGVVGAPVAHSLSPALHNAWIAAAGLDAVYVAFQPKPDGFAAFAGGLRGGLVRGVNVTAPFKHDALAIADVVSDRARLAGAANLLLFGADDRILADNTDGRGLLNAFAVQAPGFSPAAGPVLILGAGGAARGALAAFLEAGTPEVLILARDLGRARSLAEAFGPRARAVRSDDLDVALANAAAVINATPRGYKGSPPPELPIGRLPLACVVMDMVYRPLRTGFLESAHEAGLRTVDGLAMLIGQAEPSFEALFGRPPPPIDVRAVALSRLEAQA